MGGRYAGNEHSNWLPLSSRGSAEVYFAPLEQRDYPSFVIATMPRQFRCAREKALTKRCFKLS